MLTVPFTFLPFRSADFFFFLAKNFTVTP